MDDDKHIPGLDDPDSIEEMRRRHLAIGLRMQSLGVAALQELEAKAAAGQPLGLNAEDAKTLMHAGIEMERAALGEKRDDGGVPTPKKVTH